MTADTLDPVTLDPLSVNRSFVNTLSGRCHGVRSSPCTLSV